MTDAEAAKVLRAMLAEADTEWPDAPAIRHAIARLQAESVEGVVIIGRNGGKTCVVPYAERDHKALFVLGDGARVRITRRRPPPVEGVVDFGDGTEARIRKEE